MKNSNTDEELDAEIFFSHILQQMESSNLTIQMNGECILNARMKKNVEWKNLVHSNQNSIFHTIWNHNDET